MGGVHDGSQQLPVTLGLAEWFRFADRNAVEYDPLSTEMFVTDRAFEHEQGQPADQEWRKEEWGIASVLVPAAQLRQALQAVENWDCAIRPWWRSEEVFDFGDSLSFNDIDLYPWCHCYKHPVTGRLLVEPRADFLRYHALVERKTGEFYHPIDRILVLKVAQESHRYYEPSARVEVHTHHLRDYLAARKFGMVVSVVADRFANASSIEELHVEPVEDLVIAENTRFTFDVHDPNQTGHTYYRGRAILRRNVAVEPYERPATDRTPWPYFYKRALKASSVPDFILDEGGTKGPLSDANCPPYLYFRPEVLLKYLRTDGYRVYFHMRNWGVARSVGALTTIDVGINSCGLVNALAKDLRDQTVAEQGHWASCSSLPSGEVCEEMWQTRMQLNPPDSPGVVELIDDLLSGLNVAFAARFGCALRSSDRPSERECMSLSVGPVTENVGDLTELAKILFGWVMEGLSVQALRSAVGTRAKYSKEWKQIKLLQVLLEVEGVEALDASRYLSALRGLNQLRVGGAHPGRVNWGGAFESMGAPSGPSSPRQGWGLCVDAVAGALRMVMRCVQKGCGSGSQG